MAKARTFKHFAPIAGVLCLMTILPMLVVPEIVFTTIAVALFYGLLFIVELGTKPFGQVGPAIKVIAVMTALFGIVGLTIYLAKPSEVHGYRGHATTDSEGISETSFLIVLSIPAAIVTATWAGALLIWLIR